MRPCAALFVILTACSQSPAPSAGEYSPETLSSIETAWAARTDPNAASLNQPAPGAPPAAPAIDLSGAVSLFPAQ